MTFRDLTPPQKRDLLKQEYLKDGADEGTVEELIPSGILDLNSRLINVFGYTPESEVEL